MNCLHDPRTSRENPKALSLSQRLVSEIAFGPRLILRNLLMLGGLIRPFGLACELL